MSDSLSGSASFTFFSYHTLSPLLQLFTPPTPHPRPLAEALSGARLPQSVVRRQLWVLILSPQSAAILTSTFPIWVHLCVHAAQALLSYPLTGWDHLAPLLEKKKKRNLKLILLFWSLVAAPGSAWVFSCSWNGDCFSWHCWCTYQLQSPNLFQITQKPSMCFKVMYNILF